MIKLKQEDYKRQLIIANSLYELGIDVDIIKTITTVSSDDLLDYRLKQKKAVKYVDKENDEDI